MRQNRSNRGCCTAVVTSRGCFARFLNPSGLLDTPYVRVYCMLIEEADEVHRLACLELRGGNHLAAYSAELPGLAGWVSCHPLRSSPRGGDLYYLSACSHGVIARIVLADVSGHGETVSSAAVRLHDALRQNVDHWDQSALIRCLNDNFFEDGH